MVLGPSPGTVAAEEAPGEASSWLPPPCRAVLLAPRCRSGSTGRLSALLAAVETALSTRLPCSAWL
jgi:hypothetical protein